MYQAHCRRTVRKHVAKIIEERVEGRNLFTPAAPERQHKEAYKETPLRADKEQKTLTK